MSEPEARGRTQAPSCQQFRLDRKPLRGLPRRSGCEMRAECESTFRSIILWLEELLLPASDWIAL